MVRTLCSLERVVDSLCIKDLHNANSEMVSVLKYKKCFDSGNSCTDGR